ncbi:MAG TPA: gliding motility-associated C-terminal domain-containing protein [Puia sp.]|nr:gliding motility-associated C-terminal domain-containing protein [Puia sp.]
MTKWMKCWLCGYCMLIAWPAFSQSQTCPLNINFGTGDLTHWFAYTGNNMNGNGPSAIQETYDSNSASPVGTRGARVIFEYNLPGIPGIQVITGSGVDPFGGFSTIPIINGYQYSYSILLGSTSITRAGNSGARGGYIRGISYKIKVPTSATPQPYTMTYAYAMVLENGTHNSNQQPLFSATLKTADSVIQCASPSYYLPTFNNAPEGGRGATLDTATAIQNGFSLSRKPSPNSDPNSNNPNRFLQDIWTKGWREVTFDLSPYRGQQVTLTFEADNCVPGGHFAYAYIALRNSCAGLIISGDSSVCYNSDLTYSIPSLAGATYEWVVPPSWQILSNSNTTNIIEVVSGTQPGLIIAKEQNSCALLQDTIQVKTFAPPIGGNLSGDATVCAGINSTNLLLTGNVGNVEKWISSADGFNWTDISDNGNSYSAQNLNTTTTFKALVENGTVCKADSSSSAIVVVDQKSKGGDLGPSVTNICDGQPPGDAIFLTNNTGAIVNWQSSPNGGISWNDFNPANNDSVLIIPGINNNTQYRTIVKNGVCPTDTSTVANVDIYHVPYPQAAFDPADTTICYGTKAELSSVISIGTNYTWTNSGTLKNAGNGNISNTPLVINPEASPLNSTDYILSVQNAGCPNTLNDTFHVIVLPQIVVDAGNDTAVVANQPLQLNATANDPTANEFTWSPSIGLNNPNIPNPVAILGANENVVNYIVTATNPTGCTGEKGITVKVFKTGPDIFVPNAFTPGKNINNVFRPIPVGISTLQYFRVYNRSGLLVFSTSRIGQGWDGTVDGKPQDSGGYVWMAEGTDYTGRTIFKKGVMVLVR